MESESHKNAPRKFNKTVIYSIAVILTIFMHSTWGAISSFNFFLKALFFIVMLCGAVAGAYAGAWLNEVFSWPFYKIAEKINMQDSLIFMAIGAECIGALVGLLFFAGILFALVK